LLKQFTKSKPWVERSKPSKDNKEKKPQDYDVFELESLLFREFLKARFTPSYMLGKAADCWLALMDRLLTCNVSESEQKDLIEKMLELVDIYYVALDAPKEGHKVNFPEKLMVKLYPHFMERDHYASYHSTSDEVKLQEAETISPITIVPLECFTEELVPDECKRRWWCLYQEYSRESSPLCKVDDKTIKNIKFRALYQKYKRILYDAEEFEESPRSRPELFTEACAIYQVVHKLAMPRNKISKCGFA
ncbi:hypothetical protein EJB05_51208, partial [Eragrostis curvula]